MLVQLLGLVRQPERALVASSSASRIEVDPLVGDRASLFGVLTTLLQIEHRLAPPQRYITRLAGMPRRADGFEKLALQQVTDWLDEMVG